MARPLLFVFLSLQSIVGYSQEASIFLKHFTFSHGAIVRGDSTRKELALVFTADETGEGVPSILRVLKTQGIKAGFFFTGRFYSNVAFAKSIQQVQKDGHYLGPHSNQHLLYCDWTKRDSLLVTKDSFRYDIANNLKAMAEAGIKQKPRYFIPPFEWWNDSITRWSNGIGLTIFNFTPGIRINADYTWPEMGTSYKSSEWILRWLQETITNNPDGLNGAIILIHAGTDPRRKDKFYERLPEVIELLKAKGYTFKRIDGLLQNQ